MSSSANGVTTRSRSRSDVWTSLSPELIQEREVLIINTVKDAVSEAFADGIRLLNERRVTELEQEVEALRVQNMRTASKANDNEQYSRRHNLRIAGFPEEKGENCTEKDTQFCIDKLQLSLSSSDIDRAHRVGKPKSDKPRAIIVRFKSYGDKVSILKNRRRLKNSNFYVNEDLSRENQKLFHKARK